MSRDGLKYHDVDDPAHQLALEALGIHWGDVESQARSVARHAAEVIKVLETKLKEKTDAG
jgi:hypothetical protein